MSEPERQPPRPTVGLACALLAYLGWGLFPLYWRELQHVPPTSLLAHRVVWSCLTLLPPIAALGLFPELGRLLATSATRRQLLLSTALIASNWGLYIWAINSGRVTQASLGYYINPVVTILLARIVLGEALRPLAWAAVVLASLAVLRLAVGLGELPWVSVVLAVTFALYGLVRKRAPVDPLAGLAVETLLASPFALAILVHASVSRGESLLGRDGHDAAYLVGSGAATALPLLLFATAAKRLRYSTLGVVQYVSPTCQLLLAVFRFGEPFTATHATAFALIWTGVALYVVDGIRAARAAARPTGGRDLRGGTASR